MSVPRITMNPNSVVPAGLAQYANNPDVYRRMSAVQENGQSNSDGSDTVSISAHFADKKLIRKYLKKGSRIPTSRIKKGKRNKKADAKSFRKTLKQYFRVTGISPKKKWAKKIIESTTAHFIDKIYK